METGTRTETVVHVIVDMNGCVSDSLTEPVALALWITPRAATTAVAPTVSVTVREAVGTHPVHPVQRAISDSVALPAAHAADPASVLSVREGEVLRLVAQGSTNAQVAEQLTISPRTVEKHLESTYGKLHVSSRSAATRVAVEQHLV